MAQRCIDLERLAQGGLGLVGGTVKALKPREEAVGHPPLAQAIAGLGIHVVEPKVQASRETFLYGFLWVVG